MRTATPRLKSYDAMRLPHKSFLLSRLSVARAFKGHGTVSARASSKFYSICLVGVACRAARLLFRHSRPEASSLSRTAHFHYVSQKKTSRPNIEIKTNDEIPSENPLPCTPTGRGTTHRRADRSLRSGSLRSAVRYGSPLGGSRRVVRRPSRRSGPRTALSNAKAVTTWRSRPIRHHQYQ